MNKKIITIGIIILAAIIVGGFAFLGFKNQNKNQNQNQSNGSVSWQTYTWANVKFQFPSNWKMEKVFYRTPAQEAAGEPEVNVGLIIYKSGQATGTDSIYVGGVQANCQTLSAPECFTFYNIPFYTFSSSTGTLAVYDSLVKTVSYDNPQADFIVDFPAAGSTLERGKTYQIKWETAQGRNVSTVRIIAFAAEKYWLEGQVLTVDNVPNTGSFSWTVPQTAKSTGPYLIEISACEHTVPGSPSCLLRDGWSQPFLIN